MMPPVIERIRDYLSGWRARIGALLFKQRLPTVSPVGDKARIWVVGPARAGKSTLIDAFLEAQPEGEKSLQVRTAAWEWRFKPSLAVAFAEAEGLAMIAGVDQVARMSSVLRHVCELERPHLVWLCVRQDASRVFGQASEPGAEGALARLALDHQLPCLGVLTQSEESGAERDAMIAAIRRLPGVEATLAVCARDRYSNGGLAIRRHGLNELREATLAFLPAAIRDRTARGWPPVSG